MPDQNAPVRAAIDVGSNTVHIVVARCELNNLTILADEQEILRIGESVNATGAISVQKCEETVATLLAYKSLAEHYAAESIFVIATEAIRKATNSVEFLTYVRERTDLDIQIIQGNVEAVLTFYGATYELNHEPCAPEMVGVMDLGGGSTELVLAKRNQVVWDTSIPIGSGWLHDRYLPADPPSFDDLDVARTFLHNYLQGLRMKPLPPVLVATGGSANSLLLLAYSAFGLPDDVTVLTRDDLSRCEGLLFALPADELAERYQQSPKRTRVLPAGILIIRAVMEYLHLEEIRVSSHGIREGALLASARYGLQWLAQVQRSINGANPDKHGVKINLQADSIDVMAIAPKEEKAREPFAFSGRRLLHLRGEKMLEWYDEVIKHEDIEAVHRMRVASRRLRATLDAYETACNPKYFKQLYRRVKELADVLGKARDTDVMIEDLRARLELVVAEEQAGLRWLIDRLSIYRQDHQQDLEAFLRELDRHELRWLIDACLPEGGFVHG
jgi:exopolyphosphatase / guanosine-5'-triphosphate,3'-diphosphate pyrophosphatase